MNSILEELYYGNINPNLKKSINNPRYTKAIEVINENEEKLIKNLKGNEKEKFIQYINAYSEILALEMLESFKIGFNIAFNLSYESLSNAQNFLVE